MAHLIKSMVSGLCLSASWRGLDLRRPIYRQTAAYGHFGRPELDLPWEKTDMVEAIQAAL